MFFEDTKTSLLIIIAFLNFLLGFFVLLKNRKEHLNKSFGVMTVLVGVWALTAFAFRAIPEDALAYLFGYILYSSAALLPGSFLIVALLFPPYSLLSRKVFSLIVAETVVVIGLVNIPDIIIQDMAIEGTDRILLWGKYYIIYVFHLVSLFSIGYLVLIKKFLGATGIERQQVKYIILGTILPANLAMITNLILPWFGQYYFFTWAGQFFMIFLVLFSGYAIYKHHLFDVKVIATELFVFATSTILLIRTFIASNPTERWVSGLIFLSVLIFGFLLIRSVLKEVEQREELQVLSSKLRDVNYKLKDLDRARAEFINIASHQLRTPPATIKWYLSAILAGDFGALDPELKDALTKTQLTNNELMSLIEDMLNASRIERGTMEFDFSQVNLVEVVEAGVVELTPQAIPKNLKLNFIKPNKTIPAITADREKIAQVVNNFIDNAIKYTKQGGVSVSIDTDKNFVIIKVTDTGKGISKAGLANVFEKYKRGADSSKYSSGLGLGLYVAKIIVEQHHGQIWVESKGEGKGSTFSFKLPIVSDIKEHTTSLDLKQSSDANNANKQANNANLKK